MNRFLEARGLCAFYGATQVLFGIDLSIDEGGITTLLGANGAGKTTTLRSLSGMCRTNADIERVYAYFPRLKERHRQQAGTLSGGEQQMLAVGRAMMLRPKLMLLDEPSFGLAPLIVEE